MKFQSTKGAGQITAAQYCTEQLCIHVSMQKNKELTDHFWKLPQWKKFYATQIQFVNQLLQLYDVKAIIQALRDKGARTVRSFKAPWLPEIIDKYQREIDMHQPEETIKHAIDTLPKQPHKKTISLPERLNEL